MTWIAGLACAATVALTLASSGCRKEGAPLRQVVGDAALPASFEPSRLMAPEEVASWYQSCTGHANRRDWVAYKKCFADDVVSYNYDMAGPPTTSANELFASFDSIPGFFSELVGEEQLILVVNERTVIVVILMKATTLPPERKRLGLLLAHAVELNDANVTAREWTFGDEYTAEAQLGIRDRPARAVIEKGVARPTILVAKGTKAEETILAIAKTRIEIWNRHDAETLEASLAADVVWREAAAISDQDRAGFLGEQKAMWISMPDISMTPQNLWAAGDYVVTIGTWNGSKGNKRLSLPLLEVARFEDGKVKEGWRWYNGAEMARQLGSQ